MNLEKYKKIIADAFDSQNWNYSEEESSEAVIYSLIFSENEKIRIKCRVTIFSNGICDIEGQFPFDCPKDDVTLISFSFHLARINCMKRYATIRLDIDRGTICNSYSFDFNESTTSEYFLNQFLKVRNIDDDEYEGIAMICNMNKDVESEEEKPEDKYKLKL
ncbi:hypothetical protein [Dorea longicatena]|uniref:hypothetical protein n=1 Tax=Dorea longicatena TaxID=88431 RepID=UPI0036F2DA26